MLVVSWTSDLCGCHIISARSLVGGQYDIGCQAVVKLKKKCLLYAFSRCSRFTKPLGEFQASKSLRT